MKQKVEPGVYEITVPGTPHPQGRQRFRVGKSGGKNIPIPAGYPDTSKEYRKLLDAEFAKMFELCEPIASPCSVTIEVWGVRKGSDPDNMAKQVLDAMVGPILKDDNWEIVRVLQVMCFPADKGERGIKITLHVWGEGERI